MLPDLPTLLKYRNAHVLDRYSKDYPDNKFGSEEAFEKPMKFFWLSLKYEVDKIFFPDNKDLDFICGMHSEMKEIDDMWHTFLLFTRDYAFFCKKYFGKYFHHLPNVGDRKMSKDDFEIDFTRFLSYVYDNLEEESLVRWFGALTE